MQEIDLYGLIKFYVKNWFYLVIAISISAALSLIYTNFVQAPKYESKATLLIVGAQHPAGSQDSVALNNYLELFKSRRALNPIIEKQGYNGSYESLAANVTAKNEKNTDIMKVSISSEDPKKSKSMLEGAIESFRAQVQELYDKNTPIINTVDEPSLPVKPSNINPIQQTAFAIGASVLLFIVVMFFSYDYKQNTILQSKKTPSKNSEQKLRKVAKSKLGNG